MSSSHGQFQADGRRLEAETPFRARVPLKPSGAPLLHAVIGARRGAAESDFDMGCFLALYNELSGTESPRNAAANV
jgi:hypothetical protein